MHSEIRSGCLKGFSELAATVVAGAVLVVWSSNAMEEKFPNREIVYDFLVQDVCVDHAGRTKTDVSPADPETECDRRRNLLPGERLPYRKNDWPRKEDASSRPDGYQSNDTFPMNSSTFGAVIIQAREFINEKGVPTGRRGGGIYVFSSNSVASALTDDPNGVQLFYGPGCASENFYDRVLDAWIVVDSTYSPRREGSTVARLSRFPERCSQLTYAYTYWRTVPVTFRVRSNGVIGQKRFDTLISDHYGGKSPSSPNMERFYFTRELGLVRWERWQDFNSQVRTNDPVRAENLQKSEQCDAVQPSPDGPGNWVLVACRQYTNIVAARSSGGDFPREWLDRIKSHPLARKILE